MANAYKVLAQSAPAAAVLTEIYNVPALTEAICSSITFCNRSNVATTFRLAIRVNDAAVANEDYIYYDAPLPGNETFTATIGMTLGPNDSVDAYAEDATVSVNLFGQEIS